MGDVKNLTNKEAVEKLKKLAEAADVCLFVTNLSNLPLAARPMSTQEVDEQGNIWFMSRIDSDKNMDIQKDERVQLFYSNNGNYEYLSVYGTAEIIIDRKKIDELWSGIEKAWFTEGKDDPSLTLLKITPSDVYYWDTKDNKLVSLLKYAASAITGKEINAGVEGKINV